MSDFEALDADEQRSVVSWWIGQFGRQQSEAQHLDTAKRTEINRITRWHEDATRPVKARMAYRRDRINEYVFGRLQAEVAGRDITDPAVWKHATKRLKFPTGYVQAVRVEARIEVLSDDAWTEWCLAASGMGAMFATFTAAATGAGAAVPRLVFPAPEVDDPRLAISPSGVVVGVNTGEVLAFLAYIPAQIRVNAPKVDGGELPAWTPPPDGWEEPDESGGEDV